MKNQGYQPIRTYGRYDCRVDYLKCESKARERAQVRREVLQQVYIEMPLQPTVCPQCHAPYVYHQHPLKPLGVCISATCNCRLEVESTGPGETTFRLVPPTTND